MSGIGCSGDGVEMDLPSTYFGQLHKLKISKPEVQKKLVQEILDSLKGKAESVTPRPKGSAVQGNGSKKTKNLSSVTASNKAKPKKKGVFEWVKSLWS